MSQETEGATTAEPTSLGQARDSSLVFSTPVCSTTELMTNTYTCSVPVELIMSLSKQHYVHYE